MFRAASWSRLLATSSGQTAFALTAGLTNVGALTAAQAGSIVRLDEYGAPATNLWRGVEFMFFGKGANNATFDYRLWNITNPSANKIKLVLNYLGQGTATLSTATACTGDGDLVTTAEFFADTLTFVRSTTATTPDGPMDAIENTYGASFSAQAYSPAADVPGAVIVPELGRCNAFLVEFDLTGATEANAIFRLTR